MLRASNSQPPTSISSSAQPFHFQSITNSLSLCRISSPLLSSKSTLFFKNTGGWVCAKFDPLESISYGLFCLPQLQNLPTGPFATALHQGFPESRVTNHESRITLLHSFSTAPLDCIQSPGYPMSSVRLGPHPTAVPDGFRRGTHGYCYSPSRLIPGASRHCLLDAARSQGIGRPAIRAR